MTTRHLYLSGYLLTATLMTPVEAALFSLSSITEYRTASNADEQSGLQLMRLRPRVDLEWGGNWSASAAFELADHPPELTTLRIGEQRKLLNSRFDWRIGHLKVPFSNERLVAASEMATADRTLVGSGKYGTPGYQPGLELRLHPGPLSLYLFTGVANIDHDNYTEINFSSPWQATPSCCSEPEHSAGSLTALRAEIELGKAPKRRHVRQGKKWGARLAAAGYQWTGSSSSDLDSISGLELQGALKGYNLSLDGQVNYLQGRAADPLATRRLYRLGDLEMEQGSVRLSYYHEGMQLEPALAYSRMLSPSWSEIWSRSELAINYYIDGFNNRLQLTLGNEVNENGNQGKNSYSALRWYLNLF